MSEWRPIESAPKDGTDVLLWVSDSNAVLVGYWDTDGWLESARDAIMPGSFEFTHWMPLPEAPK